MPQRSMPNNPTISVPADRRKKFKDIFRIAGKTAGVGIVATILGLGTREGIRAHKANDFRKETARSINITKSGRATSRIYTEPISRKRPDFKREVELRSSAIRALEKEIARKGSKLSASRIMDTLENSNPLGKDNTFHPEQVKYAKGSQKEAFILFNGLPSPVRGKLMEMRSTPGTVTRIRLQADKDRATN
jgi:hypothetical protein